MPNRTLEELAHDQEELNKNIGQVGVLTNYLINAVEARQTKRALSFVFGVVIAVQIVFLCIFGLMGYRMLDILNQLDPQSEAYEQRYNERTIETRISNCVLEESILEQLNRGRTEDLFVLSESCTNLKENHPEQYQDALEGN